jgi:hypothetical protein
MMAKTINLRYSPTADDHVQGMRTFMLHIARMRILLLIFALGFVAGVLLLIFSDTLTSAGVVLIGLFPIIAIFLFVLSPMALRRRVRRDRRLTAERVWELNDDQISIKNNFAEVTLEWSAFNVVKETAEQYVFIAGTFVFLPKRAFKSKEQEAEFRDLVKRHIKRPELNPD